MPAAMGCTPPGIPPGFEPDTLDLLLGLREIADFVGVSAPFAKQLIEDGVLPAFRLGHRWAARPEALRATIEGLEARASGAGVSPPPPPEPAPEKGRRRAA